MSMIEPRQPMSQKEAALHDAIRRLGNAGHRFETDPVIPGLIIVNGTMELTVNQVIDLADRLA